MEWHDLPYKMEHFSAKTAALLMPDFGAKNTANICSFRKIVAPVFFPQWQKAKSYFKKMTEETPSSF